MYCGTYPRSQQIIYSTTVPWKLCKPCYPINNVDFILLLICKEMYGEKLFSGISLDVIPLVILNLQSPAHY